MSTATSGTRINLRRKLFEQVGQSVSLGAEQGADPAGASGVVIRRIASNVFRDAAHAHEVAERVRAIGRREFEEVLPLRHVREQNAGLVLFMDGTDGTTLADLGQDRSGPPRRFLSALATAAAHLDRLHERQIVHGDVRATTIFNATNGGVRLIEFASTHAVFGWSRSSYAAPLETLEMWTPASGVAPEVRSGGPVSARSDQYALATAVIESLGGPLPAGAAPADCASGRQFKGPARRRIAAIGAELRKALSPSPDARYSSCAEFAAAVESRLGRAGAATAWVVWAAALVFLLLMPPVGKWLHARGERNRQSRTSEEQREAARETLRRRYTASLPPGSNLASAAQPLVVDMGAADRFDTWRQSISDAQEKSQAKNREGAIDEAIRRFSVSHRLSMAAAKPDQSSVFLFASDGSIAAMGSPESAITWSAVVQRPPSELAGELPLDVAVVDEESRPVASASVMMKPNVVSSQVVSVSIPVPGDGSWSVGKSLSISFRIRHPLTGMSTVASGARDYQIGRIQWDHHGPFRVSAGIARREGFKIATGLTLALGDAYAVSATGTIQPWSDGTASLFGAPPGATIGPEGITPKGPDRTLSRFHMLYPAIDKNFRQERRNWGGLLIQCGAGDWSLPTLDGTLQTASRAGEVFLGVNSLSKRYVGGELKHGRYVGGETRSGATEEYWKDAGAFEVTIRVRSIQLPTGTSASRHATIMNQL